MRSTVGCSPLGADGSHEAVLRVPPRVRRPVCARASTCSPTASASRCSFPRSPSSPESPEPSAESRIEIAPPSRPVEARVPQPVSESRTDSRAESPASSRATPGPHLPEVWGRISAVEGVKKLDERRGAQARRREIEVLVESALDSHVKWKWKLRLLDSSGRPVVECRPEPAHRSAHAAGHAPGRSDLEGTHADGRVRDHRRRREHAIAEESALLCSSRAWRVRRSRWSRSRSRGAKTSFSSSTGRSLPMRSRRCSSTCGTATTTAAPSTRSKKNQHVKAGIFDEHLAPKRGPAAPLPPEWGRTKTKYPKMRCRHDRPGRVPDPDAEQRRVSES